MNTAKEWRGAIDVVGNDTGRTHDTDAGDARGGRGRIVNLTSYTGMHGNVGQANDAAAKIAMPSSCAMPSDRARAACSGRARPCARPQ
jgi:NAD(P)-dependent dehydrogenase (short-subunit alcohol dehydrogenase family)